jgi:hypothetical protein
VIANIFPSTPSSQPALPPPLTDKSSKNILKDLLPRHNFFTPADGLPNSFFKDLFIGTCLGAALRRMSPWKTVPGEPKPQECKRNAGQSKSPMQRIHKKGVMQDAINSSANTLKLTLPHKVKLNVPGCSNGTPKQFLVHVQQALSHGL